MTKFREVGHRLGLVNESASGHIEEWTCLMSNPHQHAVIWIDHHEARVFHFSATDVERLVLHPDHPTKHIHHKANSIGSGHAAGGSRLPSGRRPIDPIPLCVSRPAPSHAQ